jgi:hypothetical protein
MAAPAVETAVEAGVAAALEAEVEELEPAPEGKSEPDSAPEEAVAVAWVVRVVMVFVSLLWVSDSLTSSDSVSTAVEATLALVSVVGAWVMVADLVSSSSSLLVALALLPVSSAAAPPRVLGLMKRGE